VSLFHSLRKTKKFFDFETFFFSFPFGERMREKFECEKKTLRLSMKHLWRLNERVFFSDAEAKPDGRKTFRLIRKN
jgi:hypothetical protein